MFVFLITNNILEKCQSGFRTNHITVIALLKILNDIRCNLDNHKLTVLVLLNLTSAFNTVEHHILLNRLRNLVSLSGTVLNWFVSGYGFKGKDYGKGRWTQVQIKHKAHQEQEPATTPTEYKQ